jgi:polyferredoxin
MDRIKTLETSLVLTTGFLVLYFFTFNNLFIYIAFAFGITGILIKPLAIYVAIAWFKLADILNYFVSRLILGTLFFVVLLPVSLLYRIANKDKLRLKRLKNSNWIERNHNYTSADLDNIW